MKLATANIAFTLLLSITGLGAVDTASADMIRCRPGSLTHIGNSVTCSRDPIDADYEEDMKKLHKTLLEANYPSSITVSSAAEFKTVNSGWKMRDVCGAIPREERHADNRVNIAKVTWCELTKKGYAVRKPKIIKAY